MITIQLIFSGILEFEMFEPVTSLFWIWTCGWVVSSGSPYLILEGSYQTLLTLPEEIKQSTRTAVIIPAFFHTGWTITNGTLQEQVASVLNRIPFSMSDLLECVKISKCSPMKKGLFTHVWIDISLKYKLYVPQKRIDDKRIGNYLDYYDNACWKNDLQEP